MARGPGILRIGVIAFLFSMLFFTLPVLGMAQAGVTEYTQYRGDNTNDGQVWTKGIPTDEMVWKFKTDGGLDSSPAVANEKIYVGSKDGSVYCVDMFSGTEKWRFPTTGEIKGTPLLRSGKCYVGSSDGSVYCLNAEYGTDQWSFETGGKIVSSLKYYKDKLYFGSDDGKLYAIWSDNGSMAWNFTMSNSTQEFWSSPAISGGVLFIGDANGRFVALDAEAGTMLDEVIIDGGPARNKGMIAALEKELGRKMMVPPMPQIVTATGAAILAREKYLKMQAG